jgi:Transposase and inactivated derivatives
MELKISVSEAVELIKEIKTMPEKIFNYIESSLRESVGSFLSELMQQELTVHLGRQRYERKQDSKNYRNGTYPREFYLKNIGQVEVKVPRDRNGEFKSKVLPRSKRYEDRLREDISAMYLTGISTRTLSILSKKLIGRKISHEEVSKATEKMKEAVENWRTRDVSSEKIKYLFIDGVNFRMRVGGSVQIVPVLVVIGVRDDTQMCSLSSIR